MTIPFRRRALLAGLAGAPAAPAYPRSAQAKAAWPDQAIRLIVPYTPGGSNDAIARPVADGLQGPLGQPVVVENKPGAASTIGAGYVANAAPDGYTLLLASSSFATSSIVHKTPYDALRSFEPVARICTAPMLIVTKPKGGFPDMKALVAAAKAHPGRLQYGTAGLGGIGHFTMEAFNDAAGIKMEVVPYSGISPAQADLLAGRIDFLITTMASVSNLVSSNQVPVIACMGEQRMAFAPEVPTAREATGIDFAVEVWWGILAPKGVPQPIRQRLNREINAFIRTPGYQRFLEIEGARPAPTDLDDFARFMQRDVDRWKHVADVANIVAG
ncbi:Bug family tripartite tricarboxylate transporter substrate binding protein [Teichococcus coralli]|nr:tripartite tricarboxylate transporter substrate binding protein [Pseudoroseomonas coralli]